MNSLHRAIGKDNGVYHSLNIYNANLNFDPLGVQKWPTNLTLWGLSLTSQQSSSIELINQVSRESSRNFSKKIDKTILVYLGHIWGPQV